MRNLVFLDLGHFGICLALVLETGIPSCGSRQFLFDSASKQRLRLTKVGGSTSLNDLALSYQSAQYPPIISGTRIVKSDLCSSLENDGFVTRTFGVGKCAYSLGALVFKPGEKFVELLDAE
jgi:hypothetical protein